MTDFFTFSPMEVSVAVVIFNIILATVISFTIAFVHKKTHSGLSYSQSFFTTLILMGIIASVVLMVVQNNIFGALGLLGAFALIRFRTIIKETRDIAFVFFSLAEGVAVGLNHYAIALISTPFICIIAYILYRFNLGSAYNNKFVLLLTATSSTEGESLQKRLRENGITSTLLNSKKRQDNIFEYTLSLGGKDMAFINKILSEIASSESITGYDLLSGKESIEY